VTRRRGARGRLRQAGALGSSVVIASLALASCGVGGGGSGSHADQPIFPGPCPAPSKPAGASGAVSRVQLQVVKGGAAAIALAPVCVAGHGPYAFVIDSGATTSAFDTQLVKVLHLSSNGPGQTVSGANCTTTETPTVGPSWSVGNVPLAAQTVSSIDIPGFGLRAEPAGLLGSDVLSRFGAVQLDYQHQSLTLPGPEGPPPGPGTNVHGPSSAALPPGIGLAAPSTTVPLLVLQVEAETVALIPMRFRDQGPFEFILDTGSSVSSVDPQLVSSIGLQQTGQHQKVSGIGCREEAQQVHSGPWSTGAVSLHPQALQSVSVPGASGEINGLLGSDVLHGFGAIVIAYTAGTLTVAGH
jgi:Aspartyl protease